MSTTTMETLQPPLVKKGTHFRPDIQGLRAVAVLAVLIFHGTDGTFLSGGYVGVDIFFVISGFLITGHLLRTATKTGKIDLADFYARRVRRILPAATVVLLFTAITTLVLLPNTRWESISGEILASSFYIVNWIFAANTDYLNAEAAASPIQHFWTLAVEEQFYIIWPALLVALLYLARSKVAGGQQRGIKGPVNANLIQRYFSVGAIALTMISFAWSIYYSAVSPAPAYFVTTTRIWEMGIGAIVAVFAFRFERLPAWLGYILGASGFIAVLASSFLYDSATIFPGYAALLPTLGAAGVIIGGMSGRAESGIGLILKVAPMRWIGDLSYSLYLWHWPLLVIATHMYGGELGLWQGLSIVVLSAIPAWLSYHFVENTIRDWHVVKNNAIKSLKMGGLLMSVSILAAAAILLAADRIASQTVIPTTTLNYQSNSILGQNGDQPDNARAFGAEALAGDATLGQVVDQVAGFSPSPAAAANDNPKHFSKGCHQQSNEADFEACTFGDLESDYVVALVGDSHAAQWLPALEPIAIAEGWRLETYTKSSCPLIGTAIALESSFYSECYEWNEKAIEHLTGSNAPDHVITSASRYGVPDSVDPNVRTGSVSDGYVMVWEWLQNANVPMTVILDTPYPGINVPECVASNLDRLSECAVPREKALFNGGAQQQVAASQRIAVPTVDLTDLICPEDQCAAIVGEVLVYRDTNHLTATYARSLSSALDAVLRAQGNLNFTI